MWAFKLAPEQQLNVEPFRLGLGAYSRVSCTDGRRNLWSFHWQSLRIDIANPASAIRVERRTLKRKNLPVMWPDADACRISMSSVGHGIPTSGKQGWNFEPTSTQKIRRFVCSGAASVIVLQKVQIPVPSRVHYFFRWWSSFQCQPTYNVTNFKFPFLFDVRRHDEGI